MKVENARYMVVYIRILLSAYCYRIPSIHKFVSTTSKKAKKVRKNTKQ